MKADAPEKIYIDDSTGEFDNHWSIYQNKSMYKNNDSIEYIRKDVFIEKALKWYCLDCECNDSCKADHKCFFKQEYKHYLEGNENAIPPKFENAINPDGSTTENYRYRHFIRRIQDAFIEKACKWLNKELPITDLSPSNMLDITFNVFDKKNKKVFIKNFIKYMKGE